MGVSAGSPAMRAGPGDGSVCRSSQVSQVMASTRLLPHSCAVGRNDTHTACRAESPNKRQRACSSSCTQRAPAGLPVGLPGMGEVIDGAMQHAAQLGGNPWSRMLSRALQTALRAWIQY